MVQSTTRAVDLPKKDTYVQQVVLRSLEAGAPAQWLGGLAAWRLVGREAEIGDGAFWEIFGGGEHGVSCCLAYSPHHVSLERGMHAYCEVVLDSLMSLFTLPCAGLFTFFAVKNSGTGVQTNQRCFS